MCSRRAVAWALLVLVLLGIAPVARGQDEMIQFYLIPVMSVEGKWNGPAYLKWRFNPDGLDVEYWQIYYGRLGVMIICVEADAVDLAWLSAQEGVYTFPENLDVTPSPQELSVLEAAMEGMYIPGDWLSPSDTWRVTVRTISALMLFMGNLTTIKGGGTPQDWGWTLNTQFGNLSAEDQAAIREAFVAYGYDDSVIRTNWTLRILLKEAADQWGETPIKFGAILTL